MNNELRNKLETLIGQITDIHQLKNQGCTSKVRKITTCSASYLLKSSYDDRYREWLRNEAMVLQKLKGNQKIPVPQYVGFVEEQEASHLVMSFEEGITLTTALEQAGNEAERTALMTSFGKLLQRLHETDVIDSLNEREDWLDRQLATAEKYVVQGKTEGSMELLQILKSRKPLPVKQTIIHGDCTPDNVLVIGGEVRLFIDVAAMTVGDPRYDESLAIGRWIEKPEGLAAFYEGYKRYRVSKEEYTYFDEGLYEFF
ncbi:aminoglycoside phosphotransferase APH(3') [Ornithinibacillus scapharcae]|uniref:aminoglycoside phosphotransferase APH(3') n=1 Tax=Ornithinibacillus scapharcae TaxID=1147159 RepID=UPI000225B9BA|nr:aminoglycoside phosphotransferase APH(3') [Ornithinibacillus scapharcae]